MLYRRTSISLGPRSTVGLVDTTPNFSFINEGVGFPVSKNGLYVQSGIQRWLGPKSSRIVELHVIIGCAVEAHGGSTTRDRTEINRSQDRGRKDDLTRV